MTTRRRAILAMAVAGVASWPRFAFAQEAYPARPIRMIVPHPAGGGVDIIARQMGDHLRPLLGQPLVVDNKPGANGMIGAQAAANSPADGYTLLMSGPGEIVISPHLYKTMAYDPFRDLQPITLCSLAPNVLLVNPSVPAATAAELIALAKAKPKLLTFGSSGVGNIQHLNGELLNALAGIQMLHVPYKGAAPQITDLLGGQITSGFTSVAAAMPLIKSGKLRPIAVSSKQRVPALPDVPALAETPGLAAYELNNWFGMFAPAGLPPAVLQTISAAAVKALASPTMQKLIVDNGAIPSPQTPEEFRRFLAAESAKFAQIIREVNITAEN
jgi:tripartite-type tricarboxylate transporter receptor subunit TctC